MTGPTRTRVEPRGGGSDIHVTTPDAVATGRLAHAGSIRNLPLAHQSARTGSRMLMAALAVVVSAASVVPSGAAAHVLDGAVPKPVTPISLPNVTCDPQPRPSRMAEQLMADRYKLANHPAVTLPSRPTWREDPLRDDNWVLQFHSLWYVMALTQAWQETKEPRYLDRALFLARSWVAHNPRADPPSRFSWDDHPTALRGVVLTCLARIAPARPWLDDALALHGRTLADPDFYVYRGNHALDQSIGLLEIACFMDRADWQGLATRRINRLVRRSVDGSGVPNEQATAYSYYVYQRWVFARRLLTDCGRRVAPAFERVDRIPGFLAHATQPDGHYPQIGDTYDSHANPIPGTEAEFAASAGQSGPRPASRIAVFDAGYAFGRTGWGEKRPFADEAAFSLRFGPGEAFHSHDDGGSLTFYGFGSRLLLDPGFDRYAHDDPWRKYFRSRAAHNAVVVRGMEADIDRATVLLRRDRDKTSFEALVRVDAYSGVHHRRRLIFSRRLGYLIVEDRLTSRRRQTYDQLWHLRESSDPAVTPTRVRTRRARGNVMIQQLLPGGTTAVLTGRRRPIQGWISYDYGVHIPAPVVRERKTGRSARFLTLLVPYAKATPVVHVTDLQVSAGGFSMTVEIDGQRQRVTATGDGATIKDVP